MENKRTSSSKIYLYIILYDIICNCVTVKPSALTFHLYDVIFLNWLNLPKAVMDFRVILFLFCMFLKALVHQFVLLCIRIRSSVFYFQLQFIKKLNRHSVWKEVLIHADLRGRYFVTSLIMYNYLWVCAKYRYIEYFIMVLVTKWKKHSTSY